MRTGELFSPEVLRVGVRRHVIVPLSCTWHGVSGTGCRASGVKKLCALCSRCSLSMVYHARLLALSNSLKLRVTRRSNRLCGTGIMHVDFFLWT